MLNVNCSLFVILDPFDSAKVRNILRFCKQKETAKSVVERYGTLWALMPINLQKSLGNLAVF